MRAAVTKGKADGVSWPTLGPISTVMPLGTAARHTKLENVADAAAPRRARKLSASEHTE
jgi:hypothetical protein